MKTNPETIARKILRFGVDDGLFFLLFYGCVWQVIDPRLIHHSLGIATYYYPFSFHGGWPFFCEHLVRSGGLVEYGTRLFTQYYAFGWAGGLIVTAAAWCAGFFTDAISRRAGRPRGKWLRYVPAAMVLAMYGRYSHPLSPILSLLAALGGFWLYVRLAPRAPVKRLAVLLLACLILYHAAGAGSLLFPVMAAVDELLIGGRKGVAAAALVFGGLVPWAWGTLFGLDLKEAYGSFLVLAPGVAPGRWPLTLALYLLFPSVLAGTVLWRALAPAPDRRSHKGDPSLGQQSRHARPGTMPAWAIATASLSGLAAVAWFSLDSLTRTILAIDYHSQREQWTEVVRLADRLPRGVYSVRSHRNTMLALYHAGRLGDEMFRYRQRPGVDLFFTPEELRDIGTYYQDSRFYLELGYVNQAERCAYEALAISGDQPRVLEQLALVNVVKGRPETAGIFLRALARHPFHRRAARDVLRRLEADPSLESDPRVSQIRRNMVDKDSVAVLTTAEDSMSALLERNPNNKMAFELLMAYYLVVGRTDKVVANLPRLKGLSYSRVPRHYQEAWLIHMGSSGSPPPIPGFELDPEVLRRSREFQRVTASAAGLQDAARAAWEAGLGDSYFFYWAAWEGGLGDSYSSYFASGVSGR